MTFFNFRQIKKSWKHLNKKVKASPKFHKKKKGKKLPSDFSSRLDIG